MEIKTILVPTDFSSNARLAFSVACDLARVAGAVLHVTHIAEGERRTAMKENLMSPGATKEEIRQAVDALLDSRLAEFIAGHKPGVDVRCRVIQGNPHTAVIAAATELNADLVVVGLRGEGALKAIRTALMGSVAETIVRESPCPVVVVRPDQKV